MRVCLVSSEFAPFHGWGAGTYASLMARAWHAAGHETHVLSFDKSLERDGPRLRPGVTFHSIDWDAPDVRLNAYPCHPMRHAMGVHHALGRLHADHPFDYIEFPDFGGEGYFALRARDALAEFADAVLGVRLHMTVRDIRDLNDEVWIDREAAYVAHMEDDAIRRADLASAPCRAMLDFLRPRLGDAVNPDLPRALVVPNPFPFDALDELGPRPRREPDEPVVLFMGRLERRKGVERLVAAAQDLLREGLDASFRFLGSDTCTGPMGASMGAHLESLIDPRWRDRFVFVGRAPRDRLGAEVAAATVCCFPSLWENFPYACLEAMALGACVVASDSGGMREMIRHDLDGILFNGAAPGHGPLRDALRAALADPARRAALARAAPDRARTLCDPARVVRETALAIDRVRASPEFLARRAAIARPLPSPPPEAAPLVSVIVPVFNLHAFLPDTLRSIAAQTVTAHETIVVDDGSTNPDTIRALDDLVANPPLPNLRFLRIPHAGLSAARNHAVHAARGRWILPLDADDLIAPAFVERCLHAAARADAPPAFVTALLRCFEATPDRPTGGWIALGGDRDLMPVINAAASCVALIDRARLLDAGGFDPALPAYEDWDLYASLLERGGVGIVVPEFLILNRVRPDSMLRSLRRDRHERIRAYLARKHPGLPLHPDRALRLLMGDLVSLGTASDGTPRSDAYIEARRMIGQNLRYRVADAVNDALKRAGLQQALKGLLTRGKHTPNPRGT